jgi:hypothetical protein
MRINSEARNQKPEAAAAPVARVELTGIAPDRLKKIDDLLTDGATFRDVVQTVNAEGGDPISELAVENHFRSNLALQKRRVQRSVQKMEELKRALGNPDTAEAKLAESVLFTGLMGMTRSPMYADLEDVQVLRLKREKLELERTIQHQRARESTFRSSLMRAQAKFIHNKAEKVQCEMRQIMHVLRDLKEGDRLDADTLEKIREIYGLIREPYIHDATQEEPAEE